MAFQEAGQQRPKINWERLTRNLCPACKSKKVLSFEPGLIKCPDGCGFKIKATRMEEIVRDILEDQGRDDEWEEFSLCGGCGKPDAICNCFD